MTGQAQLNQHPEPQGSATTTATLEAGTTGPHQHARHLSEHSDLLEKPRPRQDPQDPNIATGGHSASAHMHHVKSATTTVNITDPANTKASTPARRSPRHHLSSPFQPGLAREVGINKNAQQTQSQVVLIKYNISQAIHNASLSRMPGPSNKRAHVFKHLQENTSMQSPRAGRRRGASTLTRQDIHKKGGLLPCRYLFLSVYNMLI